MFSFFKLKSDVTDDIVLDYFPVESFKKESEYLTKKRQEIIEADKMNGNRLWINNPTREITLRKPTVLV